MKLKRASKNIFFLGILTGIQMYVFYMYMFFASNKETVTVVPKYIATHDVAVIQTQIPFFIRTIQMDNSTNDISCNKCTLTRPLNDEKKNLSVVGINTDRLRAVREKCDQYAKLPYWQNLRLTGKIWTYAPKKLHYCLSPKVGCTFWKGIMRFLSKDFPRKKNIRRPSEIDRMYIHYGRLTNMQQWTLQNPIMRVVLSEENAFMFARDPYARLFSAYIDKFLLPDFWRFAALAIDTSYILNSDGKKLKCGSGVTFQQFLQYVVDTSKGNMNEHWEPIHRMCSPCHASFDVVGKLESFGADSELILKMFGLENLIERKSYSARVIDEVTVLIKYNFDLEKRIKFGCFDKLDVAKRLWLAFKYNGYIHYTMKFPINDINTIEFDVKPAEAFSKIVYHILDLQKQQALNLKNQRRQFLVGAFKVIPKELLSNIQDVFKYDFELFDYDIRPYDIYL